MSEAGEHFLQIRGTNVIQRASYNIPADFLMQLRPSRRWVLTAIVPDGTTETISARDEDTVSEFVSAHDGKRNLYFSVNPTRTSLTKKAAKTDIAAVEYIPADLDPKDDETPKAAKARYLDTLGKHVPAPTVIIDSGNGIQALFKLAERIVLPDPTTLEWTRIVADVEARTAELIKRLGGSAGTQNIDRILRLPGTINLPNAKKRKAGRVECRTSLIQFNDATCKLEDFPPPTASSEQPKRKGKNGSIDALPISQRFKNLIRGIDDPEHS
jgi:hypothetical protein